MFNTIFRKEITTTSSDMVIALEMFNTIFRKEITTAGTSLLLRP